MMRKVIFLSIIALGLAILISPILGAPRFDRKVRTKLDIMIENLLGLNEQASTYHPHYTEMETLQPGLQRLVQQADGNK